MSQRPRPQALDALIIHDIGPKGDGIARGRSGTVFVDRGLPGDEIEARVFRGDDDVMRASIERLVRPSPDRDTPPCPLYDRCGGCSLQHATDAFYHDFKMDVVGKALERAGIHCRLAEPVFCPPHTRRRATFAVLVQGGKLVMGYYRRRSHQIVDIPVCLVVHPDILMWRDRIKPYLKTLIKDKRPIDVFIQIVDGLAEVVITGPIGRKGMPDLEVRETIAAMSRDTGIARIAWRAKWMHAPDVLVQSKAFTARFGPLSVVLPPAAFLQPTAEGQQALVDAVIARLPDLKPGARVADLFSGCGTFTGPLLEAGAHVDAYDIGGIDALAKAAGPLPLKAIHRDLFENPIHRDELNKYDLVVFDPPRAGCREQILELSRSKVRHAIAISCNPATFARDTRLLIDGGFKMGEIQIVDQFVWSHHVELVAKFTR